MPRARRRIVSFLLRFLLLVAAAFAGMAIRDMTKGRKEQRGFEVKPTDKSENDTCQNGKQEDRLWP